MKYAMFGFMFLLIVFPQVFGQEIIIDDIIDVIPPMIQGPVELKSEIITITIDDRLATTNIGEVFFNKANRPLEGTYMLPLPEGTSVHDLTMTVDGEDLPAKLLDANEAREIYEGYVRKMIDPALLEFADQGMLRARVFPIEPNKEKHINIEYSYFVDCDASLCKFTYPMKAGQSPDALVLTADISSDLPITNVYSPTHNIAVDQVDNTHVRVSLEESDPSGDFVMYYALAKDEIDARVITHDGHFVLLVSPQYDLVGEPIPKDIVLALDVSGSMDGTKMTQAINAAEYVLDHLNSQDRFGIVTFSDNSVLFRNELVSADQISAGKDFLNGISSGGGTNIEDALRRSLSFQRSEGRMPVVLFLTDGLPTVGQTDIEAILQQSNTDARVFAIGVGNDVNTHLLDRLASQTNALSTYVSENLESSVSQLYTKIANPVMSNIDLDISGVRVSEMYPVQLPDLFAGAQLTVFGKYTGSGSATITLSGLVGGRQELFEYTINFDDDTNEYLPSLWASRKISHLLDQIRLEGGPDSLKEEVVELSKEFGIITPYTSFLVDLDIPEMEDSVGAMQEEMVSQGFFKTFGAQAVTAAKASREPTLQHDEVKIIGSKTFYLRNGVWQDAEYKGKAKKIKFASDAYFDLLNSNPEIGKYLGLGQVRLCVDVCYEISDSGIEKESAWHKLKDLLFFWR